MRAPVDKRGRKVRSLPAGLLLCGACTCYPDLEQTRCPYAGAGPQRAQERGHGALLPPQGQGAAHAAMRMSHKIMPSKSQLALLSCSKSPQTDEAAGANLLCSETGGCCGAVGAKAACL